MRLGCSEKGACGKAGEREAESDKLKKKEKERNKEKGRGKEKKGVEKEGKRRVRKGR